jgi:hypothetical protein
MRRSASEIISELEARIARLEKNATKGEKWKVSFSVETPSSNTKVSMEDQSYVAEKISKLIGLEANIFKDRWHTPYGLTASQLQKVVSIIEGETMNGVDGIEVFSGTAGDLVARNFEFTSLSPLTFSIRGITSNSRDIYQGIVK